MFPPSNARIISNFGGARMSKPGPRHMKMRTLPSIMFLSMSASVAAQANCNQTSTGMVPINDLGTGTYMGMMGGLYPGGSNQRPAGHLAAGMAFAAQVQPRDAAGAPDPANGKIVWLSIGFSNATQETQAFIPMATALPDLNPRLVLVDGAQGGQTATVLSTPTDPGYAAYWNTVGNRLSNAGVTDQQVQAIWFKDDNIANGAPVQQHSDSLIVQFKRIMNELHDRFPNAHLCYVASRIYAGYASTMLNPEPYAYRNGWTVKQLIGDQIGGDPQLQYDGAGASSPWLSWGVYLWADGTIPRSDGLVWICPDDYANDGTHPSATGRAKVATLLLDFFTTDSTTCSWFLSGCGLSTGLGDPAATMSSIALDPTTSHVIVRTDLKGPVRVEVFDVSGRIVRSFPAQGPVVDLDMSGEASGAYQVILSTATGRRTGRLLLTGR